MQVTLVAVGSRGDVVPFVALASRLAQRGHRVRLVSHADLLPSSLPGVELVGVGGDVARLLEGPAVRALRRGDVRGLNRQRGAFAEVLSSVAEPLAAALTADRHDPTPGSAMVVASTFATAAVTVARRHGVPVVRAHLWPEPVAADGPMPVLPFSWLLPGAARRTARWSLRRVEPLLAGFDGWWRRGRLHVVPRYDAGFTTTDLGTLYAFSGAVADDLDDAGAAGSAGGAGATRPRRTTGTRSPARTTGWWTTAPPAGLSPGTARLLERPGPPWVFVGFGSMHQPSPTQVLDVVDEACRRRGVRAIVQLPGAPQPAPEGRGRVHVIGAEPHEQLFARVSVVVHHGGSGTTGAAVRAGVPSVVVPHIADQFYWAHRLNRLGVAPPMLPRPLLNPRGLAARVGAAMDPAMVRRAGLLGRQVGDEDGTGDAVRFLEDLAHRPADACA